MARITIIGAGAFGTALGIYADSIAHSVRIWCYEQELPKLVEERRENPLYLPGVTLEPGITFSSDLPQLLEDDELILLVCPSSYMCGICDAIYGDLPPEAHIASAAKGIENESLFLMSQVQEEVLREHCAGLAEITRLGVTLGANPITFMGLAGVGDLVLTCSGDQSRNRTLGKRLAAGESAQDIVNSQSAVAEGYITVKAVRALKEKLGVDMPIVEAVFQVCYHGSDFRAQAELLSNRSKKEEFLGIITR